MPQDTPQYASFAETRTRQALLDKRVVAIAGPRQSGKSTLARRIGNKSSAYFSLDSVTTFAAAREDPDGFVRRGAPGELMIIDEIQRAPELVLAIKLAADDDQRPGQYLLTGSADIRVVPTVQDSLAGRIEVFELLPLSQDEISAARSFAKSDYEQSNARLKRIVV